MVQLLRSFSLFYRELMEEREAHSMRTSEQVHILPEQFSKCSSVLLEIWNDDTTREVYERRRYNFMKKQFLNQIILKFSFFT